MTPFQSSPKRARDDVYPTECGYEGENGLEIGRETPSSINYLRDM